MTDKQKLGKVYKILNPENNGGETVAITIEIYDNGDFDCNSIFILSTVNLQSYSNSASMSLPNLTPKFLRELANEIDAAIAKVEATNQLKMR